MTENEYWEQRAENDRRQIELAEAQAERAYNQEQYKIRQHQLLPWKILSGFFAIPMIIMVIAGVFAALTR